MEKNQAPIDASIKLQSPVIKESEFSQAPSDSSSRLSSTSFDSSSTSVNSTPVNSTQQPTELSAVSSNLTALSLNQQRIWNMAKLAGSSAQQLVQMVWRVGSHCQLDTVERAFNLVLKQFPILTCQVIERDSIAYYCSHGFNQSLDSQGVVEQIRFTHKDLSHFDELALNRYLLNQLQNGFGASESYLIRPTIIKLADNQSLVLIQVHPVLMDDEAYQLFNRWLWRFYSQLLPVPALSAHAGAVTEFELPDDEPLQIEVTPQYSFADLNLWETQMLHNGLGESHLAYWRKALGGAIPLMNFPNDSHRIQGTHGFASHDTHLAQGLTRRLVNFKRQHSVKTSVVLLAALKVLLYRYSGQHDIVVGTPTKGPSLRMAEDFGQFSNILPIRSRLSDALTFKLLVSQLAQTAELGATHGDYPLLSLVKDSNIGCYAPFSAFLQVTFNYHYDQAHQPRLNQFDVLDAQLQQNLQQDIAIDIFKGKDDYHVQYRYNGKKYLRSTMVRFAEHFNEILDNLITNVHLPIADVSCMNSGELQQIQLGFNYTQQALPKVATISDLLKVQASENPIGQALLCDGKGISFEQLNIKANQLAHELLFYGIEFRTNVAICLTSSIDLVVAMLAVSKVGAAFVLVNPQVTKETKKYILCDSNVKLLLTNGDLLGECPEQSELKCRHFLLDHNRAKLALSEQQDPILKRKTLPIDLCQIVYQNQLKETKPRGIKVNHLNLSNLAFSLQYHQLVDDSNGCIAWQDIFDYRQEAIALGQLLLGHSCLLLSDRVMTDNQVLVRYMIDNNIQLFQGKGDKIIELLNCFNSLNKQYAMTWLIDDVELDSSDWRLAAKLAKATGSRVFTFYGHEETGVVNCLTELEKDQTANIGMPICNNKVYIFDEFMHSTPIGVKGELYIAGIGLSTGYRNLDRLSADYFIPNPFDEEGETKLFKTGILGCYRADGHIEYHGKVDSQSRLGGFRIGLGDL